MLITPVPIVRTGNQHLFLHPTKLGHLVNVGREGYEVPTPTAPIKISDDWMNLISLSMNEDLLTDGDIKPTSTFDNFHIEKLYFDVGGGIVRFGAHEARTDEESISMVRLNWRDKDPLFIRQYDLSCRGFELRPKEARSWRTLVEPKKSLMTPEHCEFFEWGATFDVSFSFVIDHKTGIFKWVSKEVICTTKNKKPFTKIELVGFDFDADWSDL